MKEVVLGFAPTRRSIFSAPAAVEYANYTREKLKSMGVHFVDIDDISSDGLLHDDNERMKIAEKFKAAKPTPSAQANIRFRYNYETGIQPVFTV